MTGYFGNFHAAKVDGLRSAMWQSSSKQVVPGYPMYERNSLESFFHQLDSWTSTHTRPTHEGVPSDVPHTPGVSSSSLVCLFVARGCTQAPFGGPQSTN